MRAQIDIVSCESVLGALVEIEKRAWCTPGENIEASQEKLRRRLSPQFGQTAVLAMVGDKPAGSQYAFRFNWDEDVERLSSWDEYTAHGWTEKVHVPSGHTGFLVGVGVVPEFRGKKFAHDLRWKGEYKISELLIATTLEEQFSKPWVRRVIANARIPGYCTQPSLSVEEYCALRRPDGKLYDPVLRFHERMGARILKPVPFSMEDAESLNAGCWVLYEHPFNG